MRKKLLFVILLSLIFLMFIGIALFVFITDIIIRNSKKNQEEQFENIPILTNDEINILMNKCLHVLSDTKCNNIANDYKILRDSYKNKNSSISDYSLEKLIDQTKLARKYL